MMPECCNESKSTGYDVRFWHQRSLERKGDPNKFRISGISVIKNILYYQVSALRKQH
jgi:hypothetical protein